MKIHHLQIHLHQVINNNIIIIIIIFNMISYFIIIENEIISSDNSKILFDFFVENILKGNLTQKQFQSAEYTKRQNLQGLNENNKESIQSEKRKSNSINEIERSSRKRRLTEDD